jgi:hypothetical protein
MYAKADALFRVNKALDAIGKKLWRTTELDGLRLTRLVAWSERYSVSIEYILQAVLPVLSKAVERRTGRKSKGLGISISVLTGEVARDILLERIKKDFKGNEHVHAMREQRRNIMIEVLDDELNGKPRNPLSFKEPEEFVKSYVRSIERKRVDREKLEDQIAAMPFRSNPFR